MNATTSETYAGGYTVLDQRTGHPDKPVLGHYPSLAQASARARSTKGAIVIRTVGMRYDASGSKKVSSLIQRCGVFSDGTTFIWPA